MIFVVLLGTFEKASSRKTSLFLYTLKAYTVYLVARVTHHLTAIDCMYTSLSSLSPLIGIAQDVCVCCLHFFSFSVRLFTRIFSESSHSTRFSRRQPSQGLQVYETEGKKNKRRESRPSALFNRHKRSGMVKRERASLNNSQ